MNKCGSHVMAMGDVIGDCQLCSDLQAEIERLKRDHDALELECASWKQSSALKLAEIERLRNENERLRDLLTWNSLDPDAEVISAKGAASIR